MNRAGQNDACIPATTAKATAIATAANALAGNSPASTLTGNAALGGTTWLTDISNNDGVRLRSAFTAYNNWAGARSAGVLTHAVPAVGSATYTAMVNALLPTYSNAADQDAIIRQIAAIFDGTPPLTDQTTLDELRIRAQCKEFVDRRVQAAGYASATYATYRTRPVTSRSAITPGMGVVKSGDSHIAIITAVNRSATGVLNSVTVKESNWANVFHNPPGALPWSRVLASRNVATADLEANYTVVNF